MTFYYKITCLSIALICGVLPMAAQNPATSDAVSGDFRGVTIMEMLTYLKNKYQATFYFDPAEVPSLKVQLQFKDTPFFEALGDILSGSGLVYAQLAPGEIVLAPRNKLSREYGQLLRQGWQEGRYRWPKAGGSSELALQFGKQNATATAKTWNFKGRIIDSYTRETIPGATLLPRGGQKGEVSDAGGNFSLKLPANSYIVDIQFIGYESIILSLDLFADGEATLELSPTAFNLEEIIIKSKADDSNVRATQAGVENLSVKTIRELPSLLGEADVIKSLEKLAGVSSVGEGASGINIRGGNIDQNLILQDGAPLLNSSHALGFFSAFNPDVIGGVQLYKGSIPAEYGGRISSVIDVQLRDGNYQRIAGAGGVGMAYARLSLEGPIIRDKLSFIVGGRISYSDWMLKLVRQPEVRQSAVSFQDFTAKISQRVGQKMFITLSGYQSGDYFRYAREFGYDWQTRLLSFGWKYLFNSRLSTAFKATAGDYSSRLFSPAGPEAYSLSNGVTYYTAKQHVFYQPSVNFQYKAGIEWTRNNTKPEILSPYNEVSLVLPRQVDKDIGEEWAGFVSAEINNLSRFSVAAGLRYSYYRQLGPREVYQYDPLLPQEIGNETDSLIYGKGDVIQTYGGWEPRISVKFEIDQTRSIKMSYNRLRQYVHLVSNSAASTPIDLWQVSTTHIRPQSSHSWSLGYHHNLKQNLWQLSFEVYYKKMTDLLTYKELPVLLLNNQLETSLLPAQGRAYGFEVSARKTSGKWSGQINYTYSRSLMRTTSPFPQENVNGSRWFPANFDQPHQVNFNLRRQMSPIHSFSVQFTYRSGRPYTVPSANYLVGGVVVTHYSPRNESRIPAYHRLDFSFNVDKTQTKERGYRSHISFSIYNVYNRKNAFSVYYARNNRNQQQAYRLAIIGTVLPALSYNFVF